MSDEINPEHEELLRHLRGIQYIAIAKSSLGFHLSHQAQLQYLHRAGIKYELIDQPDRDSQTKLGSRIMVNGEEFSYWMIERDDPALISTLRDLGKAAFYSEQAVIKIVEVPANVSWMIQRNSRGEWIAETHRTWE
jgi:hypothetical protein